MPSEREHPVLLHIEDAEAWLARAKAHYRRAATVRSELDLSLAQAEVRYAWELSRKRRRAGEAGRPKVSRSSSFIRWFPLVAGSLVLFSIFVFFVAGRPRPVPRKASPAVGNLSGPEQGERKVTSAGVSSSASLQVRKIEPTATRKSRTRIAHSPVTKAIPSSSPAFPGGTVEEKGQENNEDEASLPAGGAPEAEVESRPIGREILSPREDLRPAALDLAELERVARETLISGRDGLKR
ncbi:MAG: hypothetical protein ACUVRM_00600 [Bacillota bacterium]